MGLKKSTEEKEARKIRNKRRRKGVFSAVKGAFKYLTNKEHYRKVKDDRKTKREADRLKIKKGDKSPADKAGLSLKQRTTAAKRTETFKSDRKVKDKGQKSYNKGKDKKDWVNSAYERRQKDAETATKKVAKKRHTTFKEDRKVKDKGQKSYNKGRDKKDHVSSAYERRQKDSDTAMRDAARKRHKAWKESRAKKKEDKKLKRLDRKIANQKK